MLILTRKIEQSVTISHPDGPITVMLVGIARNDRASIGIDAPQSVEILRTELLDEAAR